MAGGLVRPLGPPASITSTQDVLASRRDSRLMGWAAHSQNAPQAGWRLAMFPARINLIAAGQLHDVGLHPGWRDVGAAANWRPLEKRRGVSDSIYP